MRLFVVIVVLVATAGCGDSFGRPKDVSIVVDDTSITMQPVDDESPNSGRVKMFIDNVGEHEHELLLASRPADGSELPTLPTGEVDLDAIIVVDGVGPFEPGRFKATFPQVGRGRYVLFCNLVTNGVSHYQLGMRLPITVTQSVEDAPIQ